jgi:hypothetical protein
MSKPGSLHIIQFIYQQLIIQNSWFNISCFCFFLQKLFKRINALQKTFGSKFYREKFCIPAVIDSWHNL